MAAFQISNLTFAANLTFAVLLRHCHGVLGAQHGQRGQHNVHHINSVAEHAQGNRLSDASVPLQIAQADRHDHDPSDPNRLKDPRSNARSPTLLTEVGLWRHLSRLSPPATTIASVISPP